MLRNRGIIVLAIIFSALYWIVDTIITSVNNINISFFQSLVPAHNLEIIYIRLFVLSLIALVTAITLLLNSYYLRTRDKLRSYEMQYIGAFQQAAVGFANLDLNGNFLKVNKKLCTLLNLTEEKMLSMNFREVAHPDDFTGDEDLIKDLIEGKSSNVIIERRMKFPDDNWGWVNLAISVIRNNRNEPVYFNLVLHDITEHKTTLKNLEINEERYKGIFESNASCIAVYKPYNNGEDFILTDFNPMAEKTEKVKKHEIIGKKVTEVFPGVIDLGLLDVFREVLRTKKTKDAPATYYQDDRTSGYRENSIYYLSTAEIVAVYRDVTKRIEAENALRESEERFRSLSELLPEAIFESDLQLNLNYVNQRAIDLFGYTREEFKSGINGQDMIAPEERARALANAKKRIDQNMFGPIEYTAITKNGTRFPVMFHTNLLEKDGKPVGLRGVIIDITQQKQSERALKAAKEIQDAILSTTDVLLAYLDPDFNFIAVNQAYADADRKPREFFTGRNHFDLYPSRENQILFEKAVETGEKQVHLAKPFEYPEHPDKGISYWDWSISPMKDHTGKVQSLVLSLLDVTRRIKADEQIKFLEEQFRQAQKMEAIGMLAGGIAHDFNNILNVILGYSELILGNLKPDDSNFGKISSIMKNAQRASNLTRQLLAFSRKQVLNTETLVLNDIIKDMEKMLIRIIGENIQLTTDLQYGLNPVSVDRGQIEQIIMNLAVNAKDAMPDGGQLTIKTENIEIVDSSSELTMDLYPGKHVLISFIDNGVGIPAKYHDKVFEPFFTTKDPSKGTGLGLSTVYGIVKQSKGSIYLESDVGQGATFKVFFPAIDLKRTDKKSKISDPKIVTRELQILIVEDNQSMCEMIGEILNLEGYKTVLVTDPLKAEDIFKSKLDDIELVLTDVIMPGLNGRKLAEKLRDIKPELKVLFMSGYTDGAIEKEGFINRTTSFIQKPFLSRDLLKKIYKILEDSEPEEIL